MNKRLRLVGALSALFLFLLMAFAIRYKIRLAQLEQSTGILELAAASIPLLSLLLASCFNRQPRRQQRQTMPQTRRQAGRRRPGSSVRR